MKSIVTPPGIVPWLALGLAVTFSAALAAQQRGQPAPPPTPKAAAPIDLTGNWVSVVTEDWRWRMLVPRKGDYSSIPLNPEGRKAADTWDPGKIATDGCKPYGAAAIMRVPGRLRISWTDDTTLRIDTDAGQQTRLLRFEASAVRQSSAGSESGRGTPQNDLSTRTWQGRSLAQWEQITARGGLGVSLQQAPPRVGSLKVVTDNVRAGYLRKNGVPYSENAVITEYFDRVSAYGDDWMTVITIVDDPQYLTQQFITSSHFKREPDGSKWMPAACEQASAR